MAVGYHGSELRRGMGSSLLLLASDRHAWCEVYLDRVGWYPVDVFVAKSEEKTPPVAAGKTCSARRIARRISQRQAP